jgi:hypothetical protein
VSYVGFSETSSIIVRVRGRGLAVSRRRRCAYGSRRSSVRFLAQISITERYCENQVAEALQVSIFTKRIIFATFVQLRKIRLVRFNKDLDLSYGAPVHRQRPIKPQCRQIGTETRPLVIRREGVADVAWVSFRIRPTSE